MDIKKILLAAFVLVFCRDAAADVIIGNAVNGPYQSGTNFGTKSVGFRTESSPVLLDNIQVALGGLQGGGAGGSVVFTLNADNNGQPGAVIASIGTGTVTGGFAQTAVYTITPASPLLLTANTTYWIQGTFIAGPTNGSADWDQPNPPLAPSSPSGLATFIKYMFDSGSGPVTSTTFNAIAVNGRVADRSRGTAARAILTGTRCGVAFGPLDEIRGDIDRDAFTTVNYDHVGWSTAAGIQRAAPRVGAYVSSSNMVATATKTPLAVGTGGGRAIAYRQYRNNTAGPLVVPAAAALDGEFETAPTVTFRSGLCGDIDAASSGSQGHATAAVYVFDAAGFLSALDNSGLAMPDYLLRSDTLAAYQAGASSTLKLSRLTGLSTALIDEDFQRVDAASFTPGMLVGPASVSIGPGQSVIVVFDISAYSPAGAFVRFIDTLEPAPGFMAGMTLVGGSTPEPPTATSLSIAPATTTSQIATPVTLTATATSASGAPVPNAIVLLEVPSGPNAQPLGPAVTNANGQVSLTYTGGANAGVDVIQASIGSLQSNTAQVTWTSPGPFDHIAIAPANATIAAGASQSYTAHAMDIFDNTIGDVTASSTFTIAPNGSCNGATCTATLAGAHTVTGTYNGKTATATLNLTPSSTYVFEGFFQPVDMSTSSLIVWNTVKAGKAVPVKWLLTQGGAPVSDPGSFAGFASSPVPCSTTTGSIDDAIDQGATGGSGLQYNGGGSWQFNWQTAASEKGTCRVVAIRFNNGTTSPVAYFKLK